MIHLLSESKDCYLIFSLTTDCCLFWSQTTDVHRYTAVYCLCLGLLEHQSLSAGHYILFIMNQTCYNLAFLAIHNRFALGGISKASVHFPRTYSVVYFPFKDPTNDVFVLFFWFQMKWFHTSGLLSSYIHSSFWIIIFICILVKASFNSLIWWDNMQMLWRTWFFYVKSSNCTS